MSLKVSLSMSEDTESPDGASYTAHCAVEFDDEALQPENVQTFLHNFHSAIEVCCHTVHSEVERQAAQRRTSAPLPRANGKRIDPSRPPLFDNHPH